MKLGTDGDTQTKIQTLIAYESRSQDELCNILASPAVFNSSAAWLPFCFYWVVTVFVIWQSDGAWMCQSGDAEELVRWRVLSESTALLKAKAHFIKCCFKVSRAFRKREVLSCISTFKLSHGSNSDAGQWPMEDTFVQTNVHLKSESDFNPLTQIPNLQKKSCTNFKKNMKQTDSQQFC